MLRSFDYAIAAAGGPAGAPAGTGAAPLRAAYLEAYFGAAQPQRVPFLPSDPAVLEAWLGFFELDKALYEIEYELHQRPDWAWIPLSGIRRRLESAAS
jgi:maltose alpha-D-glucosyltransferase/alpha-amylase